MTVAYDKHKVNIMNWRNKNKAKYNEYCNEKFQEYYIKNKELIKLKMAKQYLYKKEAQIFRNILIE